MINSEMVDNFSAETAESDTNNQCVSNVYKNESLFRIALANVRSLIPKIDEVRYVTQMYDLDLFVVVESWLNDDTPPSAISIPGYKFLLKNRANKNCGGILIYYKDELRIRELSTKTITEDIETLSIILNFKNCRFGICAVYRPPDVPYTKLSLLEELITEIYPSVDNFLILGDVNCDFLCPSKYETVFLKSILGSFNIVQLISKPTRITETTKTLLDIIAIDDPSKVAYTDVTVPIGQSDHSIAFIDLKFQKPVARPKLVTYRDYSRLNENDLVQDIMNVDWQQIESFSSIDEKVNFFNTNILKVFDKHAPVRSCIAKRKGAPWVSSNTKLLMRLRDNAFRKFKRTNYPGDWSYYKQLRNFTTSVLRQEKKAYFSSKFVGKHLSTKEAWSELRQHGLIKCRNSVDVSGLLCSPKALDELNLHFSSVCNTNCTSTVNQAMQYLENTSFISPLFNFSKITETDVYNAVQRIHSNSLGADGITIKMIKLVLPFVVSALVNIINFSLTTAVFPSAWKDARVLALPKKQTVNSYDDLRPISLLSVLSKITEKIVYSQIIKHINANMILPSLQSGFRSKHSTCTALTKVLDDIHRNIDNRLASVLVLLDFSKAFDTVQHDLLLSKLKYYNFSQSSVNWFRSYLVNRQQRVMLPSKPNFLSQAVTLKAGVPQGSILGPLLFTLYTADLHKVIKIFTPHFYADDTQLYFSSKVSDLVNVVQLLNNELQNISSWCFSNGLKINPNKSVYMIVTSKHFKKLIDDLNLDLKINNISLPKVNSVRNLGVVINSVLDWTEHVQMQCKKSYMILRNLYRYRDILSRECKLKLIQTLIWSMFDYCDIVYGPQLTKLLSNRIQIVQNASMRFVFNLKRSSHILPVLNDNQILNMSNRRILHYLNFIRRLLNDGKPHYLCSKLSNRKELHGHYTRGHCNLNIPQHSTSSCSTSFSVSAPKLWNSVPKNIKSINGCKTFKIKIQELLIKDQMNNCNTYQVNYSFQAPSFLCAHE